MPPCSDSLPTCPQTLMQHCFRKWRDALHAKHQLVIRLRAFLESRRLSVLHKFMSLWRHYARAMHGLSAAVAEQADGQGNTVTRVQVASTAKASWSTNV